MNYPTRLTVALGVASCIVAGSIASTPRVLGALDLGPIVVPEPRPVQLDLRNLQPLPPEPEEKKDPPKRLIDAGAPAEAPVRETDLISSADSQAQDMSDAEGDEARPAADEIDEFDQLGAAPSTPAPQPHPASEPAPESPPAEPVAEASPEPTPPAPETPSGPAPETDAPGVAVANQQKEEPPAPEARSAPVQPKAAEANASEAKPEAQQPPERFQVAAAPPQAPPVQAQQTSPPAPATPQVPVQELRAEKGREGGGATNSGFTSFEANKHALGEYMLKVRNAVEREWRTALHLRYSGVSRTDATIRCSIRPDGTLEFVTITDAGSSLTYAVLCREAIEKAGPFEPFPFDVPEIYRNQNLEINWKFSYM